MRISAVFLIAILALVGWLTASSLLARGSNSPDALRVTAEPGVPAWETAAVAREFMPLVLQVDRDFSVRPRPFVVRLYPTQARFAAALYKLEGVHPQGEWDTDGNVVHGVLPLGPDPLDSPHRMAHIYTEWVFDGLTHNQSDAEPDPAWLYDGLAEVEASRVAPVGPCTLRGHFVFPKSDLVTPAQWWKARGSGLAAWEYCEAHVWAQAVVNRVGWARTVYLLKHSRSWSRFGAAAITAYGRRTADRVSS
jgi:hypothetical protein